MKPQVRLILFSATSIFQLTLLGTIPSLADTCSVQVAPSAQGISSGDRLLFSSQQLSPGEVGNAIAYWSTGCPSYGSGFPIMRTATPTGPPGIPVEVIFHDQTSPLGSGTCGRTTKTITAPANTLAAARIEIWRTQGNGVSCNRIDTLAHEIGHLLGLMDAPFAECTGRIMGERPAGGTRGVGSDDCRVANDSWRTSSENPGTVRPPRCRDH